MAKSILTTIARGLTQRAPLTPAGRGGRGGWWPVIRESFPGAWQQNVEVRVADVLAFPTVYRCISLIASDVAKLRVKLVQQDETGIWSEVRNPAYSPVLRKPNPYQTRIQFFETWMISKLTHGNTFALKQRDGRGVVKALFILDATPGRVEPLIAADGSLFYRLHPDELSGLPAEVVVPAREIIHDRMNPLYHPLVGVSPIYAAGLAAVQGRRIQEESAHFFANGAKPGGVLTTDGEIDKEDAKDIKANWASMFSGRNSGQVAVLADGLKYQPLQITAHDAQLIEQLKWSSETVCSVFGVPAYKVGVGTPPSHDNVEAMDTQYYAQCLQTHFEHIELLLDEGLGMPEGLGTEFDLEDLLRLDSKSQMEVLDKAKGKLTVNEMRRKLGAKPVEGGDTVYLQEQDHSLAALAKRDARDDPFAKGAAAAPPPPPAANDNDDERQAGAAAPDVVADQARSFVDVALGPVLERLVAIEGQPAPADGNDADPDVVQRLVEDEVAKAVAALPAAEPGKDGQSWEDMALVRTGPRTVELSFDHGERRNTFELEFPVPLYRGVFSAGGDYQEGDMVTFGGSLWHFNGAEDGAEAGKPGDGSKAWTLAAKRGRDGKDADKKGGAQ